MHRACSLVAGDVKGDFATLFARVATVHANHGPFAMLLCVGDFLGPAAEAEAALECLRSKELAVPVPTYLLGPAAGPGGSLPPPIMACAQGGEVAPFISFGFLAKSNVAVHL